LADFLVGIIERNGFTGGFEAFGFAAITGMNIL
jgi:hypothetical protein